MPSLLLSLLRNPGFTSYSLQLGNISPSSGFYYTIEVINNLTIKKFVISVTAMLHWLLGTSDGHFWRPEKFGNPENPYFKNIKHFAKPWIVFSYCT